MDPRDHDQRIAADLRAAIMSGDLPPGSQLPTNPALMQRYNVGGQTVQRSMKMLKDEGIIVSRPGNGIYVRSHSLRPAVAVDAAWPRRISNGGYEGTVEWRILSVVEDATPPEQVRAVFGADPLMLRHQIVMADDVPVELAWLYVPMWLAREAGLLKSPPPFPGGVRARLASVGYPTRRTTDRITWRAPTTDEYLALELAPGVPVARTLRIILSNDGSVLRPILAAVSISAGHRHELVYEIDTGEDG